MIPSPPAKFGWRHHRPSDTAGITLRLTLSEYAANTREAPQLAGTRQEVRAYTPDQLLP